MSFTGLGSGMAALALSTGVLLLLLTELTKPRSRAKEVALEKTA